MKFSTSSGSFPHFSLRCNNFFVIIKHDRRYDLFLIFFMSLVRYSLLCEAFHGHFTKMFKLSVLCGHLPCLFCLLLHLLPSNTPYILHSYLLHYILTRVTVTWGQKFPQTSSVLYSINLDHYLEINSCLKNESEMGRFTDRRGDIV